MSGLRPIFISVVLLVGVGYQAFSQQRSPWQGEIEVGSILSSESATPFWLRTNQYGIIPTQAPAGLFQAAFGKSYRRPDSIHTRKLDWGFKLNPVVTYDNVDKSKLLLPEAHVKVRFKAIEFYIGRRREVTGLGDTTLSSGFYAVSGNSTLR